MLQKRKTIPRDGFDVWNCGSPTWARTRDLRINSPSLYRLSYRGIVLEKPVVTGSARGVFYPCFESGSTRKNIENEVVQTPYSAVCSAGGGSCRRPPVHLHRRLQAAHRTRAGGKAQGAGHHPAHETGWPAAAARARRWRRNRQGGHQGGPHRGNAGPAVHAVQHKGHPQHRYRRIGAESARAGPHPAVDQAGSQGKTGHFHGAGARHHPRRCAAAAAKGDLRAFRCPHQPLHQRLPRACRHQRARRQIQGEGHSIGRKIRHRSQCEGLAAAGRSANPV